MTYDPKEFITNSLQTYKVLFRYSYYCVHLLVRHEFFIQAAVFPWRQFQMGTNTCLICQLFVEWPYPQLPIRVGRKKGALFRSVLPKTQVSGLRLQHKGEMGDKDFLHLLLIFLPYLRIFQSSAANLVCSTLNTVESCVLFSDQTYLGPIT